MTGESEQGEPPDVAAGVLELGVLHSLGHPHLALGQHDQTRAVWREALELYRQQVATPTPHAFGGSSTTSTRPADSCDVAGRGARPGVAMVQGGQAVRRPCGRRLCLPPGRRASAGASGFAPCPGRAG
ncbi:hypothetical protein [Lentzea sp.]|uniref:hypothetical protein n=1 Tax=Lentzea sp. TaxID=56099 RepID=UPI002CAE4770|nr:hypothetical protein [Lentzea sp.]HUQ61558.1 hypothetical protein [Lentzea sp.]